MIKNLTCIECPLGCNLIVDVENCRLVKASGNKCPKGETFARSEVENPLRIFTSTVLCIGLDLKMLPVRTSQPIPKARIIEAAQEVQKIKVTGPVSAGEIIKNNFLGSGADLVATRSAYRQLMNK
jgi:CxxC motif-containing protein